MAPLVEAPHTVSSWRLARTSAQTWSIDVATELEAYLSQAEAARKLQDTSAAACDSSDRLNFVEAALLLQNGTVVYGRKVDYLRALTYETLDNFGTATTKKGGGRGQGGGVGAAVEGRRGGEGRSTIDDWDVGDLLLVPWNACVTAGESPELLCLDETISLIFAAAADEVGSEFSKSVPASVRSQLPSPSLVATRVPGTTADTGTDQTFGGCGATNVSLDLPSGGASVRLPLALLPRDDRNEFKMNTGHIHSQTGILLIDPQDTVTFSTWLASASCVGGQWLSSNAGPGTERTLDFSAASRQTPMTQLLMSFGDEGEGGGVSAKFVSSPDVAGTAACGTGNSTAEHAVALGLSSVSVPSDGMVSDSEVRAANAQATQSACGPTAGPQLSSEIASTTLGAIHNEMDARTAPDKPGSTRIRVARSKDPLRRLDCHKPIGNSYPRRLFRRPFKTPDAGIYLLSAKELPPQRLQAFGNNALAPSNLRRLWFVSPGFGQRQVRSEQSMAAAASQQSDSPPECHHNTPAGAPLSKESCEMSSQGRSNSLRSAVPPQKACAATALELLKSLDIPPMALPGFPDIRLLSYGASMVERWRLPPTWAACSSKLTALQRQHALHRARMETTWATSECLARQSGVPSLGNQHGGSRGEHEGEMTSKLHADVVGDIHLLDGERHADDEESMSPCCRDDVEVPDAEPGGSDGASTSTQAPDDSVETIENALRRAQLSYSDILQRHGTQPECSSVEDSRWLERVVDWRNRLDTWLEAAARRKPFRVSDYRCRLMERLAAEPLQQSSIDEAQPNHENQTKTVASFGELVQGESRADVCRMFLTTLLMCNEQSVVLEQTTTTSQSAAIAGIQDDEDRDMSENQHPELLPPPSRKSIASNVLAPRLKNNLAVESQQDFLVCLACSVDQRRRLARPEGADDDDL